MKQMSDCRLALDIRMGTSKAVQISAICLIS